MELKGELDTGDIERIIKGELARRFPAFALVDLYVPYTGTARFTLETEREAGEAPAKEVA